MSKTAKFKKKKWKLIFKGKIEDFDNSESLAYWKDKPAMLKFQEVSHLIKEALAIKGKKDHEPRLLRSTAFIKFK